MGESCVCLFSLRPVQCWNTVPGSHGYLPSLGRVGFSFMPFVLAHFKRHMPQDCNWAAHVQWAWTERQVKRRHSKGKLLDVPWQGWAQQSTQTKLWQETKRVFDFHSFYAPLFASALCSTLLKSSVRKASKVNSWFKVCPVCCRFQCPPCSHAAYYQGTEVHW